eukprot:10424686-Ditylum_brightwellii.AAC.1
MERANTRNLEVHWFLTDRVAKVSSLQHLTVGDVNRIKSDRQSLSKMRLVINKIKRLGVAAGVNTNPKIPSALHIDSKHHYVAPSYIYLNEIKNLNVLS